MHFSSLHWRADACHVCRTRRSANGRVDSARRQCVRGRRLCIDHSRRLGDLLGCSGRRQSAVAALYRSGRSSISVNQNSGLRMDVNAESRLRAPRSSSGRATVRRTETFTAKPQGNGYAIVAAHSGLCLAAQSLTGWVSNPPADVCNGSAPADLAVERSECEDVAVQMVGAFRRADGSRSGSQSSSMATCWCGRRICCSISLPVKSRRERRYTAVLQPNHRQLNKQVLVSNTGHDMFCPGIANLPDGRLLVNGGSSSSKTSDLPRRRRVNGSSSNLMKIPAAIRGSRHR